MGIFVGAANCSHCDRNWKTRTFQFFVLILNLVQDLKYKTIIFEDKLCFDVIIVLYSVSVFHFGSCAVDLIRYEYCSINSL